MEGFFVAHHDPNTPAMAGAAYGDTGDGTPASAAASSDLPSLYDCYTHTGTVTDPRPVTDDYGPPIDIRGTLLHRH